MNKTTKAYMAKLCIAALCLAGCPTEQKEDPKLKWSDPYSALTFETGDNLGEIKYSIALTEPVEAESYTLYYMTGTEYDSTKVSQGTAVLVPQTKTGTITGLGNGEDYSAVLVAKKSGYPDAVSDIKYCQSGASGKMTKIKIINVPVGETDGANDGKEVAFILVQARGKAGFGVWGGELKAGSGHKYEDNEIKEETPGKGYILTKLYDENKLMTVIMKEGLSGGNTPLPEKEEEVIGSGEVTALYKFSDDQTVALPTTYKKWNVTEFVDDPVKGYLELDWEAGTDGKN